MPVSGIEPPEQRQLRRGYSPLLRRTRLHWHGREGRIRTDVSWSATTRLASRQLPYGGQGRIRTYMLSVNGRLLSHSATCPSVINYLYCRHGNRTHVDQLMRLGAEPARLPASWSGWMDLNHRPDGSKPPGLAKLSYTQINCWSPR